MVEQEAVNFEVASSSLAGGAMSKKRPFGSYFLLMIFRARRERQFALA